MPTSEGGRFRTSGYTKNRRLTTPSTREGSYPQENICDNWGNASRDDQADRRNRNGRIKDSAIAGTPVKTIASIVNMTPAEVRTILDDMVPRGCPTACPTRLCICEGPRPRVTLTNGEDQETSGNEGVVENNEYVLHMVSWGHGAV